MTVSSAPMRPAGIASEKSPSPGPAARAEPGRMCGDLTLIPATNREPFRAWCGDSLRR